MLFLIFIACFLVNVCSFHPSFSSPTTVRFSDSQNEYIVNLINYKIGLSFSNILKICLFSLGIIILLWLSFLHTICHVRYVSFTTNLNLLSKKRTFKPPQFSLIFLSFCMFGLLFEMEDDQIILFISCTNLNFGSLIDFLFEYSPRSIFTALSF